jgi:hypothetical protein
MAPLIYRDFLIRPATVSFTRETNWLFVHRNYDGAPDANDDRCGFGETARACMIEIDAMLEAAPVDVIREFAPDAAKLLALSVIFPLLMVAAAGLSDFMAGRV